MGVLCQQNHELSKHSYELFRHFHGLYEHSERFYSSFMASTLLQSIDTHLHCFHVFMAFNFLNLKKKVLGDVNSGLFAIDQSASGIKALIPSFFLPRASARWDDDDVAILIK